MSALVLLMLCAAPAMGEKITPDKDLTLNESELKFSTDLLQLTNSTYLVPGTTREDLVSTLKTDGSYQVVGPGNLKNTGLKTAVQAPSEVVYVYVTLDQNTPLSTVDPFAWEVSDRDEASKTVVAWVEVSRLVALASVPGVTQIRPVLPPVVNTGSVMSEGDRIHLADQVRAQYGLTGAGVKIGVISDGVDHWSTAAATGDLPTNLHVLRNSRGGDEGTAMLEIVHDTAPDAELYFCDHGNNTIDFNTGIDALADAGCTIICDDISWLEEPFFEDGTVATHIQTLTSTRNILYVTSAGNHAEEHYQGTYLKDGTTNWHDFSGGTASEYKSLYILFPPGASAQIVLEWDDPWTSSSNDYDMYLYTLGGGELLAKSNFTQNGNDEPIEYLSMTNSDSSMVVTEIDILNVNGAAATRTLEVFIYPPDGMWVSPINIVTADSVFGHAAATNAVAVGAIGASDPGADTIEDFSSRGPSTIRYPSPVLRSKPDVTGIDGVSVTGSGGFLSPFIGTSASAPDVAAVAALVWSGAPTRTASEVRTALLSSSDDLGSPGPDYTFGYGRVNALSFVKALGIALPVRAGFYADGHVGQAPYSVGFLDQSTGSPTAWLWDFGDGTTSTEQSPTHLFNRTGAYNVALTASNDQASDTAIQYRCIIVNVVPVAAFTANQTAGGTPFTVQYTDQSTGATSYQWQFGDGATSTEQNPVHTYTGPGTYTVTLFVSEPDYGSVFTQNPGYITVSNQVTPTATATSTVTETPTVTETLPVPETPTITPLPTVTGNLPEANFTVTPQGGAGSMSILVIDSSVNATSVRYELGDGTATALRNFQYTYSQAGTYTIEQNATNAAGSSNKTIGVTVPGVPATTPTVSPTITSSAFNGRHNLPGILQAEDYDLGGEGVAYHDTTPGNLGGVYRQDDVDIEVIDTDGSPNVGWIRTGEWLAYTVNIGTAGTYNAGFRVSSTHTGSSMQVYLDDGTAPIATVNVPNTGDWSVFQTVPVQVTLPAGQNRLKLMFPNDFANVNWISFVLSGV